MFMTDYTFTIVHCEQYTMGMSHLKKNLFEELSVKSEGCYDY
jgi:hypothetical protein